jgi:histidinol dehydrogenase
MTEPVLKIIPSSELTEAFYSTHRLSAGLETVSQVLQDVRTGGDRAVREYAHRFDRANPEKLEVSRQVLTQAEGHLRKTSPDLYDALCRSRDLALAFAKRQRESFEDFEVELSPALITGQRTIPVERAGIYVPAGRFPLLSSVIMGSAPALAAGVEELILCSPPMLSPEGGVAGEARCDERIMAAASLCGIHRVFACGGAQAIAAMAYGTETIPQVQVIVGPGNKYVAEAKRLVYGEVGIDMLAGPTEVMVIADASAHPEWVAADLLAQAEHDPDAQAVLITLDPAFATLAQAEVQKLVDSLPADAAARSSFARNSCIILAKHYTEAIEIANRKAPEHLELALDPGTDRDFLERTARNYGSLFIGHRAAEVLGDYAAGLNHTLPTSGSARFTGGLSVRHFLKTVTTLRTGDGSQGDSGVRESLAAARLIAEAEGLTGHALAAKCRL